MISSKKRLIEAEKRFKKVCNIKADISSFPLRNNFNNIETNKTKSKEFSEVFTPLWLVDEMISQVKFTDCNVQTLDLCAGYGQFSIRLMRFLHESFPDFKSLEFLKNTHAFSELQLSSCYKLLNTFGVVINLFIGDSKQLNKLPKNARGIWCYIESWGYWANLTKTIKSILSPNGLAALPISEEQFVITIGGLIQKLDTAYTMTRQLNNITLKQMDFPEGRLMILSDINALTADTSMQVVDTPQSIIREMLDCVENLEKKSILVLFNTEFLETLIHQYGVDPKSIVFGADVGSALEIKAVSKMYGVNTITFSKNPDFLQSIFKGRKFDVCFSNPPYNRGMDLKILKALIGGGEVENSIAKEYVVVHPSTWIFTSVENSFKKITANILKSAKFFNANNYFAGIDLAVPGMISHFDTSLNISNIDIDFFNDKFIVNDINHITKFGKEWQVIENNFIQLINKKSIQYDNIVSHKIFEEKPGKYYCQLARQRGHVNNTDRLVEDDFYTLVVIDKDFNKGIRLPLKNKVKGNVAPTYEFNSEIERDNFLNYVRTDFVRFCLAIAKNNLNLDNSVLKLILWLDFTQSWDDEKLFKYFGINQETQDYIRNFLPDYYGLRK